MKSPKSVSNRTSSFTKLSLWRKLFNLKLSKNDKLEDLFLKFDTIIRELRDLGSNIDERDNVCHLFLSLPCKCDTAVKALETVSDVKMDFVKARLLDEEMMLDTRNGSKPIKNDEVSFKASNSKGCYICESLEHFQAQCLKGNSKPHNYHRGSHRGNYYRRGQSYRGSQKRPQYQANVAAELVVLYAANVCSENEGDGCFFIGMGSKGQLPNPSYEPYQCCPKPVLKGSKIAKLQQKVGSSKAMAPKTEPKPIKRIPTGPTLKTVSRTDHTVKNIKEGKETIREPRKNEKAKPKKGFFGTGKYIWWW